MVRNEEIDTEMQLEEETPMSHAQRRKLKKRKRDDPDGDASEGEEFPAKPKSKKGKNEEGDDKTSASKNVPARLHSVWVGNLAFKTTPDDLRGFFKDVEGEITRVKMPRKEGGEKGPNKGFAYVDFATTEAKEAAIAQSERPLHGRKLLIKDDSNWQGSHSVATLADPTTKKAFIMTKTSKSILAKQKQPPCPVLFVGNLSFETTIDSLREHLESNVVKRVKKDKGKKVKKRKDEEEDDSGSDEEEGGKRKGGKEEEILTFEPQPAKPDSDSDSDSDSSSENNEPKPSNVKQEEPTKPSKAADPKELLGLRAIRLGTFEDSGSCKGWAFLDFHSTAHSTASLLRLPNHYLHSRELKIEYASVDAVRRGGYVEDPEKPGQFVYAFKDKEKKKGNSKRKDMRPPRSKRHLEKVGEVEVDEGVGPLDVRVPGERVTKVRPKPGSALAMAKRESVAIVPSQGKKVVF